MPDLDRRFPAAGVFALFAVLLTILVRFSDLTLRIATQRAYLHLFLSWNLSPRIQ